MQNIKNFKSVLPSVLDAQIFGENVNSIQFLMSEDGQDWYESQSQFADDTIKIMYDADGVIRSLVDKPVRERGNIYAVSMFFPLNMSVAEIAVQDFPDGVTIDGGKWMFDGENVMPRVYTSAEQAAFAEKERQQRLREASIKTTPLQDTADLNKATNEELAALKAWKMYRFELRRMDVQIDDWPVRPQY